MAHTWPGKKKTAFCCLPLMQFHATCNKILEKKLYLCTKNTLLFTTDIRFISYKNFKNIVFIFVRNLYCTLYV